MEEKGTEIQDCSYEQDMGFRDFMKRNLENVTF